MNPDLPSAHTFHTVGDLYEGAVLVIDKPFGWTSFDVVNKLKWIILRKLKAPETIGQRRSFKIGHAGTLDPLATGMLVVCTGRMTKLISQIQGGSKTYTGIIRLGQTTPSFDLETAPEGDFPYHHLTEQQLHETAATFLGEQLQTPPAHSAKWIDGRRAYEAARKGEMVEMRKALIEIHGFRLTRIQLPDAAFEAEVSKGTYIRSLAHDFGQRLGSGSHLAALRRTSCAPYGEADMISMDEAIARLMRLCEEEQS
ncbi:MAG: tRNA pseudouridine(55) synthase TruB [Flavobacteriales bacterium]